MYRRFCVLLAAVALPLGGAGDAPLDRATLRGVMGVNVVIDPIAPEIQKEGVTMEGLRTRLEEKMRDAGIPLDTTSTAFLALRLRSVRAARGPLAITMTIGLYQAVTLVRDPKVKTATATWERTGGAVCHCIPVGEWDRGKQSEMRFPLCSAALFG